MPAPDFNAMVMENIKASIKLQYQSPPDDYRDEDEAEEDGEELWLRLWVCRPM